MMSNILVFESFSIFFGVFVFDVWELKVFVVNYFSKVFDIFKYFTNTLSVSIFCFHGHV